MRKYLDIDLASRSVEQTDIDGEDLVNIGRYFIAKRLLECGAATVDPLSSDNPLIFSAGPFAGTNWFECQQDKCRLQKSIDRWHQRIKRGWYVWSGDGAATYCRHHFARRL